MYDLSAACQHEYSAWFENPKGAQIKFGICSAVECDGYINNVMACVYVPGK